MYLVPDFSTQQVSLFDKTLKPLESATLLLPTFLIHGALLPKSDNFDFPFILGCRTGPLGVTRRVVPPFSLTQRLSVF